MTLRGNSRLTLVISVAGAMIVALDGTVLLLVQPAMQRELHGSLTQMQWASTGYLIAVASLLVFAGRLGDRYGHQRLFVVGVLGFAASSAGIGLVPHIGWVIGLRVVQGIFAALLQPATLGMLRASYPRDRLGMAIAVRASAIGVAAAAGPVIGGVLAGNLGWRAVFFLNIPVGLAIAVLATAVLAPAPRESRGDAFDVAGAGLLAVALAVGVHTIVQVPAVGWAAPATVLGLGAVAAAGAGFWWHERRAATPLVPPEVIGAAGVGAALAGLLAASTALFGTLFVATYYLQDVLTLDPFESGLRVLPLSAMMVLGAPVVGLLLRRFPARGVAGAAMVLVAVGIGLLSRLDQTSTALASGVCFLILGAGFSAVMVSATGIVVGHAPPTAAGVAGGLQQTVMNVGPILGVAGAATLLHLGTPAAGIDPLAGGAAFVSAMGPTLLALAAVPAAGALLLLRIPTRPPAVPTPR